MDADNKNMFRNLRLGLFFFCCVFPLIFVSCDLFGTEEKKKGEAGGGENSSVKEEDVIKGLSLAPAFLVSPAALHPGDSPYSAGKPFFINPNPQGLAIVTERVDGVLYGKLYGTVKSGVPEDLKLFNHPNYFYDAQAAEKEGAGYSERENYVYGDFPVFSYAQRNGNDKAAVNPNLQVSVIKTDGGRCAAVTVKGILEQFREDGEKRDLNLGGVITQKNEALALYTDDYYGESYANGSFSINKSIQPPQAQTVYRNLSAEYFTRKDLSGEYIYRGGLQFLIWEEAKEKKVYFETAYNGEEEHTFVEIDYSDVVFIDEEPSTFWFYSRYNYAAEAPLPFLLPRLLSQSPVGEAYPKDPYGLSITLSALYAPRYDSAGSSNGPFPYFFPYEARIPPTPQKGSSEVYENSLNPLNELNPRITLFPVFYPSLPRGVKIKWLFNGAETLESPYCEAAFNADYSVSIILKQPVSEKKVLAVSASITSGGEPLAIKAEIHFAPAPRPPAPPEPPENPASTAPPEESGAQPSEGLPPA
ncbi:MAG: hypothetical protein LBC53_09950 [Spirochaetaceae bacterium]|jgi:hypothetical protein|nr:hypothetical protein [Spirochaetaceae bacterium]